MLIMLVQQMQKLFHWHCVWCLVVFLCTFCTKCLAIVSSVCTVRTCIKGCVCYCGQSLYSTRKLLALLVCQCGILTLYDRWTGTVAFSADGVCAYRSGEPQPWAHAGSPGRAGWPEGSVVGVGPHLGTDWRTQGETMALCCTSEGKTCMLCIRYCGLNYIACT